MRTSIHFYVYSPICIKVRMSDMKQIMTISQMRKRVRNNTRHSIRERHSCPRRDLNPQSQQTNGRRPTPYTSFTLSGNWIGFKNGYIQK